MENNEPTPNESQGASGVKSYLGQNGFDTLFFVLVTMLIIMGIGSFTGKWASALVQGLIYGTLLWLLFKTAVGEKILSWVMGFLAWCGGVPRTDIKKMSGKDQLMYARTGATLFVPTTLAFAGACFVAADVFHCSMKAMLFAGIVWATIIFTIDAALVSTMKRDANMKYGRSSLLIRAILALALGVLISSVAELRIFDKEIKQEFAEELEEAQTMLDSMQRAELALVQARIDAGQAKVDAEYADLKREMNESIGGRRAGYGDAATKKDSLWNQAKREFENQKLPEMLAEQDAIKSKYAKKRGNTVSNFSDGIASRLDYLDRAGDKHSKIALAHLFLFLFFIAIEMVPVLAKMMAMPTQYEYDLAGATATWEKVMLEKQQTLEDARFAHRKQRIEIAGDVEAARISKILQDLESIDASAQRMDGRRNLDDQFDHVAERVITGAVDDADGGFFSRLFGKKQEPVG